jgi:hypothetical protein
MTYFSLKIIISNPLSVFTASVVAVAAERAAMISTEMQ